MSKGKKSCGHCGVETGPRTKICPNKKCGKAFFFKPKPRNAVKTTSLLDWKELKKGQKVKAIRGYGQYSGVFTVFCVEDDGVKAYGKEGYAWLYMGEPIKSKYRKGYNEPHKLQLVKE